VDKPAGMKAFGLTKEFAAASKVLAANQGLYNGFLAADYCGDWRRKYSRANVLPWMCADSGVYGAITASRKILWVQAVRP